MGIRMSNSVPIIIIAVCLVVLGLLIALAVYSKKGKKPSYDAHEASNSINHSYNQNKVITVLSQNAEQYDMHHPVTKAEPAAPAAQTSSVPPYTPVAQTTSVPPYTPVAQTTSVPPYTPVAQTTSVPPYTPVAQTASVPPYTPVASAEPVRQQEPPRSYPSYQPNVNAEPVQPYMPQPVDTEATIQPYTANPADDEATIQPYTDSEETVQPYGDDVEETINPYDTEQTLPPAWEPPAVIRFAVDTKEEEPFEREISFTDSMIIGRKSDCQLYVAPKYISRMHLELTKTPEGVFIRNLSPEKTCRYTLLNKAELDEEERKLEDGDVIEISRTRIEIHMVTE